MHENSHIHPQIKIILRGNQLILQMNKNSVNVKISK